jgi:hypothetical protein
MTAMLKLPISLISKEENMFCQRLRALSASPRALAPLLFLLALGLASCSSPAGGTVATSTPSPISPTQEQLFQIGKPAPVGPWVITITGAYLTSGDSSYTSPQGKTLLVFNISYQNRSNQTATMNGAAGWSLRDSSGMSFPVNTQSGYSSFRVESVAAGDNSSGELVFEVPQSVHHFILTYAPTAGGSPATWEVGCGADVCME